MSSLATPPVEPLPRYGNPLSLDQARQVMAAAEQEAACQQWPMVITIVDSTGHLVMVHRLEHAQYGSIKVSQLKAQTALDFRRPTRLLEQAVEQGGLGLRLLSVPGVVALEGGLPLIAGGLIVGAIGVSGMQSTQDAQVAMAGAAALD
ncbi:GlcG/HbpS family heme-binding protein [Mangrovitalea sediminis]|uniref:GlcG/HbpS family heme-binding protein n=1 Tax=Mangrovitalea sediminis TaxID=1982043 RepID=UPI000BE4F47A|nr:heme-binding protein [Mangrovitalea sediminis]